MEKNPFTSHLFRIQTLMGHLTKVNVFAHILLWNSIIIENQQVK